MIGAIIGFLSMFMWVAGIAVVILLGILVYDRRYKAKDPGQEGTVRHGFQPTPEVFIDPKDGCRYRVYYNPYTGERDYVRE